MQVFMPQISSSDDNSFVVGTLDAAFAARSQPQPEPEPVVPAAQAGSLEARVADIEAFNVHLSGMVESLVDTILHVRNHDVQKLETRVRDLEQALHLERCNRDLAEVSRIHPKERIVVFVGGTYFGDNIKYAWLAMQAKARELDAQCWFLPFNAEQELQVLAMGGQCLPHTHNDWSAEHLHTALSCAVAVISDHLLGSNPYAASLLAGARQLQMWHGVSIKEIGLRNLGPLKHMTPQFARVLRTCGPFSRFVGTAAHQESEWRRWFAFDQYSPVGYPRNDVLHREPSGADLVNVDMDAYGRAEDFLRRGKRVFLYAPTFRDAHRGKWVLQAGLDRVAKAIADAGDCLIVNLHPVEQPMVPELAASLPGVTFVKPRTDVYPLLTKTTALITDYSSIMFDYLHLDRPVMLFRPDHEAYTQRSRKLFDEKLATPPGPVVTQAQALIDLVRKTGAENGAHVRARHALRDHLFDRLDGDAGSRLVDLVGQELELALPAGAAASKESP